MIHNRKWAEFSEKNKLILKSNRKFSILITGFLILLTLPSLFQVNFLKYECWDILSHISSDFEVESEEGHPKSPFSSDLINIIDYENEGIDPSAIEYDIIWNRDDYNYTFTFSIAALEFVGATGYPQVELELYGWGEYLDNFYNNGVPLAPLRSNITDNDYFTQVSIQIAASQQFLLSVQNLDPVDRCVYNLSIHSTDDVDWLYTEMYYIREGLDSSPDAISITYFGISNPVLYREEGDYPSRFIINMYGYSYWGNEKSEHYFRIENLGPTITVFSDLSPYHIAHIAFHPLIRTFRIMIFSEQKKSMGKHLQ